MKIITSRWMLLVVANVMAWGMLSFYQFGMAQNPRPVVLPFANSNEQRSDLVREAREIRDLLKETNTILRERLGKDATGK